MNAYVTSKNVYDLFHGHNVCKAESWNGKCMILKLVSFVPSNIELLLLLALPCSGILPV